MKEVIEILKAVRELLSDKNHWTTDVMARDREGHATECKGQEACSWCLFGAIAKLTPDSKKRDTAADYFKIKAGLHSLSRFNDFSTHEQVLALLDKFIIEHSDGN